MFLSFLIELWLFIINLSPLINYSVLNAWNSLKLRDLVQSNFNSMNKKIVNISSSSLDTYQHLNLYIIVYNLKIKTRTLSSYQCR